MSSTETRLPPGQWTVTARDDERLEFDRSVEFWTGTGSVTVRAVRETTGPLPVESGPLWRLELESGQEKYPTEETIGYAGSRSAAERRLFDVMESIGAVVDDPATGDVDHETLVDAIGDDKPPVRPQ